MLFSILAQVTAKKANVQGIGTFIVLVLSLFSGFIVYPDSYVTTCSVKTVALPQDAALTIFPFPHHSIPGYYKWIYWISPMSWALQGLASNEFMSGKYDNGGDAFLSSRGFQVGRQWIGFSFLYMIPFTLGCTFVLTLALKYVRIEPEKQHVKKHPKVSIGEAGEKPMEDFNLPFIPVDLTFDKLVYEVKASTSDETLRLLNEVSGSFTSGRLCALMG